MLATIARLIDHPVDDADVTLDLQRLATSSCRSGTRCAAFRPVTTVSYGEIAARLGTPRLAREVAEACAANMLAVVVPCHRDRQEGRLYLGLPLGCPAQAGTAEREHEARLRRPTSRLLSMETKQ